MAEANTTATGAVAMDAARLVLAVVGAGLIGYGAWLHYPPAGFVSSGALVFAVAVIGAMRAR
ncbi:hypothetical protein TSH7_01300 [Azospirillum sp. TSH7]|uniref:hypothetical protein n=1 Tax=unclassified Azospirillum TaxID=2630922 RepID=UPI000D61917D|nr:MULTISPECIES: hypothetical protein [unclassified Azospirillum]PWC69110.1 hypothetical protein TSH7_01300 [Azospirillum sp. TSH7]PWC71398.1 hypothetical protein TSH20_03775 [Azospirillum sp. TSH20]